MLCMRGASHGPVSVCLCLSVCHKSVEFRGYLWHQKTIESLRYRAVLFYCDPVFSRFIRTPTCFAVSLCLLKCQRQLLGIRWCDRVRNDEVLQRTGLNWLSHLLSRRRISVFGHVAQLTTTHRQTWLFSSTSTYHSTDLLTARGVAHLVVHGTTGSTSYETIPPVRLESSGGVLSAVDMVVQRRDGPRRLRDHDIRLSMRIRAYVETTGRIEPVI